MSAPEDDDDDMMEDEEGEEEEPKASDEAGQDRHEKGFKNHFGQWFTWKKDEKGATFDIWNLSESTRLHTCCFWLTSPFRDPWGCEDQGGIPKGRAKEGISKGTTQGMASWTTCEGFGDLPRL